MAFFWHPDFAKFCFGQGSEPDPTGGAYDVSHTPSRLGRGIPPPHYPVPTALNAFEGMLPTLYSVTTGLMA